jgi:twitching motility protein PilU
MVMDRLFSLMAEKKASDIFLAPGSPIHIKINGMSIPVNQQKLDADGVERLLQEILTERQWQEFLERRELNAGYGLRGVGSFRINVFRQRGAPACVVRYIPSDIPALESLNLPPLLSSS